MSYEIDFDEFKLDALDAHNTPAAARHSYKDLKESRHSSASSSSSRTSRRRTKLAELPPLPALPAIDLNSRSALQSPQESFFSVSSGESDSHPAPTAVQQRQRRWSFRTAAAASGMKQSSSSGSIRSAASASPGAAAGAASNSPREYPRSPLSPIDSVSASASALAPAANRSSRVSAQQPPTPTSSASPLMSSVTTSTSAPPPAQASPYSLLPTSKSSLMTRRQIVRPDDSSSSSQQPSPQTPTLPQLAIEPLHMSLGAVHDSARQPARADKPHAAPAPAALSAAPADADAPFNPSSITHATFLLGDARVRQQLRRLVASDNAFEEILEFGFPGDQLEEQMMDSPVSPVSPTTREMTLKITLTPPAMRAEESLIYGWSSTAGSSRPNTNTSMPPGANPHAHHEDVVIQDDSDEDQLRALNDAQVPAQDAATKVRKMFGKLRKKQPLPLSSSSSAGQAVMITSADV